MVIPISKNPLILVDGSCYLYRAYHAIPFLTNSAGEPTGAVYGVFNMVKNLLIRYNPCHMAVIFDANEATFRHQIFKDYKSHRSPMPDNLRTQIDPVYNLIRGMGLPLFSINGVEADDVIGTLALEEAERHGRNVLIISNDKDMAQLVSPNIILMDTRSNRIFDPDQVQLTFGVPPSMMVDYLALIGDSSDNIPGVPGIGKTIAKALLQNIGSLEILYQHLEKVHFLRLRGAKTIADTLEKNRDLAFLSYELASIKTNVPLNISDGQLTVQDPDPEALKRLFQKYEFKGCLNDLKLGKWLQQYKNTSSGKQAFSIALQQKIKFHDENQSDKRKPLLKNGYKIIYDRATLDQWIKKIYREKLFVFETQTDGTDIFTAHLVGLSFSVKSGGEIAYLPVHYDYLETPILSHDIQMLGALKPMLEDPSIAKIGRNMKFTRGILKQYDIELDGIAFDVILESYLLDDIYKSDNHFRHTLNVKKSVSKVFNHNHLLIKKIPIEEAAFSASENLHEIFHLHQNLWKKMEQEPELKKLFEEIDMPLLTVLSRIESKGVLIDVNILSSCSLELTTRIGQLEVEVYLLVGEPFNLSSTKKIQEILYNKQKLPVLKKTPNGAPSTDEEVLCKLSLDYPLPKLLLEYRRLTKLKSTYIDKLPKMINPQSKRVHTSYHQTITFTGRLSSSNPNLQNIPIRNETGRRIRQAFIASPDSLIISADYSQIELRIMAHLSRDPGLLNAFNHGADVHRATAAEIFCVPLKKVTDSHRRRAKAINFGLIYGISPFGLARQLSIPYVEAQKYMKIYFERYPGVLEYMERIRKQATETGYVSTIEGRRFYLPDIDSRKNTRKKIAERMAINAPIQGTASDIIKRAMIAIDNWLQQQGKSMHMIMQVHDELVFEMQRDVIERGKMHIKHLMEDCFALEVPLKVDIGVGKNWDQAH